MTKHSSTIPVCYPLTSIQREILFDQLLHLDLPLYHLGGYVQIEGAVDVTLFQQALAHVVQQNDSLRLILVAPDPLPLQQVLESVPVHLEYQDFSEQTNPTEAAHAWIKAFFAQSFQLYAQPLFHFALLKLSHNQCYWIKKYHHIIMDCWGFSLVIQQVAAAYNALLAGTMPSAIAHPSYLDFVVEDQAYVTSAQFQQDADYWRAKYQTLPEPLLSPYQQGQAKDKISCSHLSRIALNQEFFQTIEDFALQHGSSPFQIMIGVLYCYFVRIGQRDNFVLGLPTLNRRTVHFQQMVGMCTNLVPALYRFGRELTFLELLQTVGQEARQSAPHRRFPLGEIKRQVNLAHGQRSQLFDVSLSYVNANCDAEFGGAASTFRLLFTGHEQNGLTIYVEKFHKQGAVSLLFDGSLNLFTPEDITRLQQRLIFLLAEVIRHPTTPIQQLLILPEAERQQVLIDWNNTVTDDAKGKCIHHLFEEQVERTPDAVAVVFDKMTRWQDDTSDAVTLSPCHPFGKPRASLVTFSYAELNARANQLAHHLQALGVKSNVMVGLCVERSPEMLVGLLGILKAGGVYVPLDPAYPAERLAFMLADAAVAWVVTDGKANLPAGINQSALNIVDLNSGAVAAQPTTNPLSPVRPDDLAYVIYTSGSTGQPKGVLVAHAPFAQHCQLVRQTYELTQQDRVLQFASLNFDVSLEQIFPTLLAGASLVIGNLWAPAEFHHKLTDLALTVMDLPLTYCRQLLLAWTAQSTLVTNHGLRLLIVGNEAVPGEFVTLWQNSPLRNARLLNAYGPTEAVISTSVYEVPADLDPARFASSLPIANQAQAQSQSNRQLYILDAQMQPVPIGVAGELYIGGRLAQGYLNQAELTASAFVANPFTAGTRLYKSGDLVRYLPDGTVEFLGRVDQQVKIRGFRVELGEIEAKLRQHPQVQEAVVVYRKEQLIAYLVVSGSTISDTTVLADQLRTFLRTSLPEQMIPAVFIPIDAVPRTANGKVDRLALPMPDLTDPPAPFATQAPRTATEAQIVGIWQRVLARQTVGVFDNFFDVGGHSLSALQVANEIQQTFAVALPIQTLFARGTVMTLAEHVDALVAVRAMRAPLTSLPATLPLALSTGMMSVNNLNGNYPPLNAQNTLQEIEEW